MDYSGSLALRMRRIAQRVGILRPTVRLYRRLLGKSYEDRFHRALVGEVGAGDVVWDVGANVGLYTEIFAEKVGLTGRVVAFEPSPAALNALRAVARRFTNVTIEPVALSDREGEADFFVSADKSAESRVTDGLLRPIGTSVPAERVTVMVKRADGYLASNAPTVIKIDVEGSEVEVLKGMRETLASNSLRAVFVEVHFMVLAERGQPNAPSEIKAMLQERGFSVSWTDPSHLVARRQAQR